MSDRPGWIRAATAGAGCTLLLVCGCGHSAPVKHARTDRRARPASAPVCSSAAREAIAGFLGVPEGSISLAASTGNNGNPQCSFRARSAHGERVEAIANLYTGPQPYFILERTAVEASQSFTPKRLSPPPQAIPGLGLEADWFPAERQLLATDGIRLVTVSVSWQRATQARERALAKPVARTYLKSSKHGAARAKGYPSGG
jgi:hypothetical protein